MLNILLAAVLFFNEFMPSNIDTNVSPVTNYDSWVELYNPTGQAVNLAGWFLSDAPADLRKWKMPGEMGTVPAYGFKVIWMGTSELSVTQATFKLSCEGGTLYLSDADGQLVTSESYPEALSRTPYARKTDGGTEWGFAVEPTPGASNNGMQFATDRLPEPQVNLPSQTFNGSLSLTVTIPEGTTLRYTTDGSLPTLTNGTVSTDGRFQPMGTVNYRFRLFREGYLPSLPVTRTYIRTGNTFTLPMVNVVADRRFLDDNTLGILVKGTNGRTGNGQDQPCNFNMPWERAAHFQYILPDGTVAVDREVEISVSGGWSRATDPHSLKLKGGKEFDGQNTFDYVFFAGKPFNKNKVLLLRNGGNDAGCKFKDAGVQEVVARSGIDIDVQAYQPVVHYLNGNFKGVMNLREPNNKQFAYANFGIKDDNLDMFEMSADSNVYMMVGTSDVLDRIYELGAQADQPTAYEELKRLLDIDEFTNYMAMQLYIGSTDWPHNNMKGYRKRTDGRYRFVTFDLDFAFNTDDPFNFFANDRIHTFNYIYDQHRSIREEIKLVTFFLNLLEKSADFRKKFIDTYCIMGGSVFQRDRANAIIDELANRVRPMQQLTGNSPDQSANELKNGFNNRMENMMNRLQQFGRMQLSGVAKQSVSLKADVEGATLFINGLEVPYTTFDGKLFAPVTLRAEAPAGYAFAGWRSQTALQSEVFGYDARWRYYDRGRLDDTAWRGTAYADASWSEAPAPLGYAMDETTTISYGPDAGNKYPTTYFRKTFTLQTAPKSSDAFTLNYQVDDGFVVYVNGTEAARYNMPAGDITFDTYSVTYAPKTPLTGSLSLPASLFRQGSNVVAVEVHNVNATSTDLFWAGQLLTTAGTNAADSYYATTPELELPSGDVTLTACFEPLSDQARRQEGLTPVRINEVSAANSIQMNDHFKRNDWVELYNTTDADIDVEGMYLSDNPDKPLKYQITRGASAASTVIPAHGYLLVWCDKLEPLTQLHASFKLAAEGGDVLLTAADQSWQDRLAYTVMEGDQTVGRYPDGASTVYTLTLPTASKRNQLTSYMAQVEQPQTTAIETVGESPQNPLRLAYAAGALLASAPGEPSVRLTVYSLAGQQLLSMPVALSAGFAEVPLSQLSRGCYVARMADTKGRQASCKFVIR